MTKSEKFSRSPIAIAIVALWILNDLVLKQAYGNFWTGKISDITGLVAFPFFICLILAKIFKSAKEIKLFTISILLVHSVFAFINIRQDWNDLFHNILFSNPHGTADLEDLFCIPITIPILYFLFFKIERVIGIFLSKVLFPVLCCFAFVGTSHPEIYLREFRTIYPVDQVIRLVGERQTFIWYSMECNYNQFTFFFFKNTKYNPLPWHKIFNFEERQRKPHIFSKEEFENHKGLLKSPVEILLRQKDFTSVKDSRYNKMRFELDLKLNLEPGDYLWCLGSDPEYSNSCNMAYEERDSNPQAREESNDKLLESNCKWILIR